MEKNEILEKWAPSVEAVEHYLKEWEENDEYNLPDKALLKLFRETYPANTDLNEIIIKCAAINTIYSTHIFNIHDVAKHILDLKIDHELKNDIPEDKVLDFVDKLAKVEIGDKKFYYYSFATKYCSFTNPDVYPIYDSYVEKVLVYYRDHNMIDTFETKNLKEYKEFCNILQKFKKRYHLEQYNAKQIDQYLWLMGKEAFPKTYKK